MSGKVDRVVGQAVATLLVVCVCVFFVTVTVAICVLVWNVIV